MAAFSTLALAALAAQGGIKLGQLINQRRKPTQPTTDTAGQQQTVAPPEPPQAPNPYPAAQAAAGAARTRASSSQKTRTRTRTAAATPIAGGMGAATGTRTLVGGY